MASTQDIYGRLKSFMKTTSYQRNNFWQVCPVSLLVKARRAQLAGQGHRAENKVISSLDPQLQQKVEGEILHAWICIWDKNCCPLSRWYWYYTDQTTMRKVLLESRNPWNQAHSPVSNKDRSGTTLWSQPEVWYVTLLQWWPDGSWVLAKICGLLTEMLMRTITNLEN